MCFAFICSHKHCEILFSVTLLLLSFLLTHVIRTSGTWIPLSLPDWNPGSPQRALSLLQLFEGTVILHSPNITGISGMDAITLEDLGRQEETDCDYTWLCLIITTIWLRHPLPLHVTAMYTPPTPPPNPGTHSRSSSGASGNWFTGFLFLQIRSSSWWLQHLYKCPFQYLSSRNRCSALTEIVLSLC